MTFYSVDPLIRFWKYVNKTETCWVWTGGLRFGYGTFWVNKSVIAHRYSYELLVGPIPEGLVLDHLCRNRACVNPKHLEPITRKENSHRAPWMAWGKHGGDGMKAKMIARTHCKRGHEFNDENTKYIKTKTGLSKTCRKCTKEYHRVRRTK